jgi:hypothetical protein
MLASMVASARPPPMV